MTFGESIERFMAGKQCRDYLHLAEVNRCLICPKRRES